MNVNIILKDNYNLVGVILPMDEILDAPLSLKDFIKINTDNIIIYIPITAILKIERSDEYGEGE